MIFFLKRLFGRSPERPLPEFPSPLMQGLFDPPEEIVTGAVADSPTIEPQMPAERLPTPLPHAPREIKRPMRLKWLRRR